MKARDKRREVIHWIKSTVITINGESFDEINYKITKILELVPEWIGVWLHNSRFNSIKLVFGIRIINEIKKVVNSCHHPCSLDRLAVVDICSLNPIFLNEFELMSPELSSLSNDWICLPSGILLIDDFRELEFNESSYGAGSINVANWIRWITANGSTEKLDMYRAKFSPYLDNTSFVKAWLDFGILDKEAIVNVAINAGLVREDRRSPAPDTKFSVLKHPISMIWGPFLKPNDLRDTKIFLNWSDDTEQTDSSGEVSGGLILTQEFHRMEYQIQSLSIIPKIACYSLPFIPQFHYRQYFDDFMTRTTTNYHKWSPLLSLCSFSEGYQLKNWIDNWNAMKVSTLLHLEAKSAHFNSKLVVIARNAGLRRTPSIVWKELTYIIKLIGFNKPLRHFDDHVEKSFCKALMSVDKANSLGIFAQENRKTWFGIHKDENKISQKIGCTVCEPGAFGGENRFSSKDSNDLRWLLEVIDAIPETDFDLWNRNQQKPPCDGYSCAGFVIRKIFGNETVAETFCANYCTLNQSLPVEEPCLDGIPEMSMINFSQ